MDGSGMDTFLLWAILTMLILIWIAILGTRGR